jgi:hypothetical protein
VRAHLLTRGWRRQDDYTFFPRLPENRWWERYGEYADFDYPLLLVEGDGADWRAYLGGMTTSREDVTGTPIRLSLAVEGACGGSRETHCVTALVDEHVRAQAGARAGDAPTAAKEGALRTLDQVLDKAAVTALFSGTPVSGAGVDDLVDTAVRHHAESGESPPQRSRSRSPSSSSPAGSWVAGIGGAEAREAFVAHAGALLSGTATGRALLLNSLDDPGALPRPAPDEHLVVLADAPEERFGGTPVAIGGKASGRSPAAREDSRRVWAALAAGAVAGSAAVLLRRRHRRRRNRREA